MTDNINNDQITDDLFVISAAVNAFNVITGDGLLYSAEQGKLFLTVLDLVRSQQVGTGETL